MATVFNKIDKVAGDPSANVTVTVQLVWDKDVSPVAKIEDEDTMIQGPFTTVTDDTGLWEADLVPNDEITPADSVYRVTEILTSTSETTVYYISVVDNATPNVWVGDLLHEAPDWA